MIANERELYVGSLAKNAAAFFKISRSSRRRAFSFRSRRNSACTAPSPVGARPSASENFVTHSRMAAGSTPRLRAASEGL